EPVAHDSPETQTVWGGMVSAADHLTVSITAGSSYFKPAQLKVFNAAVVITDDTSGEGELPGPGGDGVLPGHGGRGVLPNQRFQKSWEFTPVSSSNGINPLAVHAGQYVTFDVTVDVPQDPHVPVGAAGRSLPAGPFTGKALIHGSNFSKAVDLSCTYLAVALG